MTPARALAAVAALSLGTLAVGYGASLGVTTQHLTAPAATPVSVPRDPVSIASAPLQGVGSPGPALTDQATLSGGTDIATGTLTFSLYGPAPAAACAGAPVASSSLTVTHANGGVPYVWAAAPGVPIVPGTYWWQVTYAGDANDAAATSACGSESVIVAGAPGSEP